MSDVSRRKELQQSYKQAHPEAGVYRLLNSQNGKSLLGTPANLASLRNKLDFAQSTKMPGVLDQRRTPIFANSGSMLSCWKSSNRSSQPPRCPPPRFAVNSPSSKRSGVRSRIRRCRTEPATLVYSRTRPRNLTIERTETTATKREKCHLASMVAVVSGRRQPASLSLCKRSPRRCMSSALALRHRSRRYRRRSQGRACLWSGGR